eukprot:3781521-Rhodomonas_salina.4
MRSIPSVFDAKHGMADPGLHDGPSKLNPGASRCTLPRVQHWNEGGKCNRKGESNRAELDHGVR